ncbi:hypothetical protein AXG93_2396s1180 [Marchantia polymorpha subsp. ruderalis]|uniref:Uncharacterized protein n=1 Tax=Marchantia polymorpha subsp. ruderalis TaxID=1480154 RepID=A0A176VDX0_MARPO|nr:hypothetical protein AXG93_2396s1180 [Marchantia polymorpha subsp. ruderalis]
MSSFLRLSKVWPRYEALQSRWAPLATSSRFCGAPVCDQPPTIATADRTDEISNIEGSSSSVRCSWPALRIWTFLLLDEGSHGNGLREMDRSVSS